MPKIQNSFLRGRMNKDFDERLVPKGEYLEGHSSILIRLLILEFSFEFMKDFPEKALSLPSKMRSLLVKSLDFLAQHRKCKEQ